MAVAAVWAVALPCLGQRPVVHVSLKEIAPLKLVEYVYGPGPQEREIGLDGVLEVTLKNAGAEAVTVRDLHVHGLLFVSAKTGEKFLLIHPCDCAFVTGDEAPPPGQFKKQTHHLEPGSSERFTLEDFGCGGGMWDPPPPGEYLLSYRVLPADAGGGATQKPVGENRPPAVFVKECREKLLSGSFWAGAFASDPVKVLLKRPVRKRVRG